MREFVVHPEIVELIASHGAGETWKEPEVNVITCIECNGKERLKEDGPPLSVILEVVERPGQPMILRQRYAHASCRDSGVFAGHPDEIEPRMGTLQVNLSEYMGEATIFFAPLVSIRAGTGYDRKLVDVWTENFVDRGLIRSTTEDMTIGFVDGWDLGIGPSVIYLTDPKGEVQELNVSAPPAWMAVARGSGRCLVVTGDIDLQDLTLETLTEALNEGRLALGLVAWHDL